MPDYYPYTLNEPDDKGVTTGRSAAPGPLLFSKVQDPNTWGPTTFKIHDHTTGELIAEYPPLRYPLYDPGEQAAFVCAPTTPIPMSDQPHSPEPWRFSDPGGMADITDANGTPVCYEIDASLEDLRRIVACVNFLRGVPTEELERIVKFQFDWRKNVKIALNNVGAE
jgi:hypothetical protein